MKTLDRIFFNIIILIFLQSCGYQPLLTSQNQKFSVKNINIYGDKKLARTLGNYFDEIDGVSNTLIFERLIKGLDTSRVTLRILTINID